jgi:hypothetical protein
MTFKKTLFLFILLVLLGIFAWMDRPKPDVKPSSLFPEFTTDAATLINIHNKGENVTLAKSDKDWKIGDAKGFPVDPELIKKALDSIAELKKAKNMVSNNPESQKIYEVDPNRGIEVKVSDGKKKLLADFLVGKTGPDFMSTYLRKAGSNEVFQCDGYHLRSAFSRTVKNWYDVNVCKFTPEEIAKITIATADKKLTLKKDHDAWQLIDPNQAPAKKNLADDIANTLSRLRAIDLATVEKDKLAEYELSPPARQVTVSLNDGTEKKISIGKKNDQNQYYVKADKQGAPVAEIIYLVSQYNVDKLSKTFEDLKEVPPLPAKDGSKSDNPQSGGTNPPPMPGLPPGMNVSGSGNPHLNMPPNMPPSAPPSQAMPPAMRGMLPASHMQPKKRGK